MSNLLEKASIILTPTAYNDGEVLCVKPTDGSGDFDFSRNSAATRVNAQGLVENVQILSSNLVQNGDFSDGENNWSFGGDWELVNGTAEIQSATTSYLSQVNVVDLSVKNYRLQYEVVTTNGSNFRITGGSSAFGTVILDSATIGVKTIDLTSNGTQHRLIFTQSAFRGSIDNISLIEITDDTNLPRINYEGGCGSWLFEPQSTNLIPYSEDFSQWGASGSPVITANQSSPDGSNNAYLLETSSNSDRLQLSLGILSAVSHTQSMFVKYKDGDVRMNFKNNSFGGSNVFLITSSGVVAETPNANRNVEDYGNGWFRISVTYTANGTSSTFFQIFGDLGTPKNGFYIFGAQVEEQSYSTSYIPTSGTSVTRNQDVCTNGGSLASINSTEGVLYWEGASLIDGGVNRIISLSSGNSLSNSIRLYYFLTSPFVFFQKYVNGVRTTNISTTSIVKTDFNKIAIRYNSTEISVFSNGVNILNNADANVFAPNTLNSLDFSQGGNNLPFYGKTKALAVWKEALSDQELTELTTI